LIHFYKRFLKMSDKKQVELSEEEQQKIREELQLPVDAIKSSLRDLVIKKYNLEYEEAPLVAAAWEVLKML